MNRDGDEDKGKQSRSREKSKWGKPADDHGFGEERDALGSKLDVAHGVLQAEAEAEIRDFELRQRTCRDTRRS